MFDSENRAAHIYANNNSMEQKIDRNRFFNYIDYIIVSVRLQQHFYFAQDHYAIDPIKLSYMCV